MPDGLSREDRLWLGAHGDQRYIDEWTELQRHEDTAAAIERTRVRIRELDEAGISYDVITTWGSDEPIGVYPHDSYK